MKLYVALCHEYHSDPVVEVYAYEDEAIKAAEEFARSFDVEYVIERPVDNSPIVKWFSIPPNDDYACVIKTELKHKHGVGK